MDTLLNDIYFKLGHAGSFGGRQRLYNEAKKINDNVTMKDVKEFLIKHDTYTLHKPARFKFKTRRVTAKNVHHHWETDLSDLSKFSTYNKGYTFLLFVIDVYSRYLWLRPLKNKKTTTVKEAFEEIFNETEVQPAYLGSDLGTEYTGAPMTDMLRDRHIGTVHTYGPHKMAIVERVQRTIKNKLFRYFTYANTYKYIDILQKIAYAYNNEHHRSIASTPFKVYNGSIPSLNIPDSRKPCPILDNNTLVRISRVNRIFVKGYRNNWSKEIFKIHSVSTEPQPYMYTLVDMNNTIIEGRFYRAELQEIAYIKDRHYQIDTILQTTGQGKNKKHLVSWVGYPESFNSIVSDSDLSPIDTPTVNE